MKTLQILIILFVSNLLFGQNSIFFYEYRSIPDSTNKGNIEKEIMALNIEKDKSEFYSFKKFKSDSTLLADSNKGVFSMPPNKKMNTDRVITTANCNEIDYITDISFQRYSIKQNINLKWDIIPEFDKIFGYSVQKATTEFGGRKWYAWFASEIPIQFGPYKFFGLPGLIIKIEDVNKNHIFELIGIKKSNARFIYPELNNSKFYKISNRQFIKIYKNYRKRPMADSVDSYPDQTDANGILHSGAEIFRENEKRAKERIAKDNNLIELNLLK